MTSTTRRPTWSTRRSRPRMRLAEDIAAVEAAEDAAEASLADDVAAVAAAEDAAEAELGEDVAAVESVEAAARRRAR